VGGLARPDGMGGSTSGALTRLEVNAPLRVRLFQHHLVDRGRTFLNVRRDGVGGFGLRVDRL
jgi:hypothetical protein